jgi:hypothetical protein
MHDDDLSIKTARNPRVIRMDYGDSIIVTNEPPEVPTKTWEYFRGRVPDSDIFPPLKPWSAFVVTASKP